MKKFFAIFAALIAVLAVLAFSFQGIKWKSKIKEEYGGIRPVKTQDIDAVTELPDGWKEYKASGIKFYAPDGLEYDDANYCYYTEENSLSITIAPDGTSGTEYVDSFLAEMDITHDEMKHFCKKTGKTYPNDLYELFRIQTSLSKDDFKISSYKAAHTFYKLMGGTAIVGADIYFIKNSGGYNAFVMQANAGQEGFSGAVSAAWLFESSGKFYHINVVSTDGELNLKIARSLKPLEG